MDKSFCFFYQFMKIFMNFLIFTVIFWKLFLVIRPSPCKAQTTYFLITCLWLVITGLCKVIICQWKVIICLWIVIICLFIVVTKQVSTFFMSLITRIFWLVALLAWPLSVTFHFNWHERPKCPWTVFVFITIFDSQKCNKYCMK